MSQQEATTQDIIPQDVDLTPEGDEEEDVPSLTLEEAYARDIEDGTRLVAGTSIADAVDAIKSPAIVAVDREKSLTVAYKEAAQAIAHFARRLVLLPDGTPDWAGDSSLSQTILAFSLDRVLEGAYELKGDRKRIRSAILAHVDRTFLELEIRNYVASFTQLNTDNGEDVLLFPDGPDDTSALFVGEVRKQYRKAGKAVPTKYQSPEDKQSRSESGPGQQGNPITALRRAHDAATKVIPRLVVNTCVVLMSGLVTRMIEGDPGYGTEARKQYVAEASDRLALIARYAARHADGKATDSDTEDVMVALWSDEDTFEESEQDS